MNRDEPSFLQSRDVDVARLQERVVSNRAEHPPAEPARVAEITATTLPEPERHDLARVAELYERPTSPPPFSGTQIGLMRFLRGPLRNLARLFYRLATILDRRLQENRSEAFRRLTQEVAILRQELEEIRNMHSASAASSVDESAKEKPPA